MAVRLPSLESLRTFDVCARHGNFSRAAAELCLTPAAVSQRIRALEADIGRRLFIRSGPRIRLSGDGETLFRRTSQIMAIAYAAIEDFWTIHRLRLTVTPTFASRWLAMRAPDFEALHPEIELEIDVSADIRSRATFDLAIRSGLGDWPNERTTALFPIERTPMLRPDLLAGRALRTPSDLADFPLIPDGDWRRWFTAQGLTSPRQGAERRSAYPSQDLAAQAAMEGKGVALLSPRLFATEIARGRLEQPFPFTLSGPEHYWLVEPSGPATHMKAAFRDWLLETLR